MAVPKGVTWPRDPHTEAKHGILQSYLNAYWPILLQSSRRHLTYAEGFAGPNEYADGEDGSPNHALAALLRHRHLLQPGIIVNIVLVEERRDRLDNCVRRIHERFPDLPPQVRIHPHQGTCADTLPIALEAVDAWKGSVFANLDPFGAAVPYSLIERVAANGKASEVFVTFNADFFTRWAQSEGVDAADGQFGTTSWRDVDQVPSHLKKRWLIDAYRTRLSLAGFDHSLAFELLDDRGHQLALVHATSGIRGVERMKDAMWKTDPVHGIRFRDPRDTQQLTFTIEDQPNLKPLQDRLVEHFSNRSQHKITDLRDWATTETTYRATHLNQVLKRLREDQRIRITPSRGIEASNWVEPTTSHAKDGEPTQDALF